MVRIKLSFAGLIANLITNNKVLGHEIENPCRVTIPTSFLNDNEIGILPYLSR